MFRINLNKLNPCQKDQIHSKPLRSIKIDQNFCPISSASSYLSLLFNLNHHLPLPSAYLILESGLEPGPDQICPADSALDYA